MSVFLTIGMAVYDDFMGLWPTIQAIRLEYPDLTDMIEFVVVDNNPSSTHGQTCGDFVRGWVKNSQYVPFTEVQGTAAPRNKVFDVARGKYVLVLDPHVLLERGVLRKLLDYYRAHPETSDILSGPLVYDDLSDISTHFADEWRGGMWGTWATDPRGASPSSPPFEIPGMGLGLFSCRKEAWLGFNPNFRQFGGEEMYIHEKFRRAGHKALCLPFLRWTHRFSRPSGVPYPLSNWHKARNYFLGLTELGMDLKPAYDHFVGTGLVTQVEWEDILSGADKPKGQAVGGCTSCQKAAIDNSKMNLSQWFLQARNKKSDINEHVDWIAQLSEGKEHVAVYGGHHDISTIAVLFASPKKLSIVDVGHPPQYPHLQSELKTQIIYLKGDDRKVRLGEVDLVFIDSVHRANHVYDQLVNIKDDAKRVLLHDTIIYGENGDDGGPGIMVGLRRFMKEFPEWSVIEHRTHNHGMTLISRLEEDKKELPSLPKMAWNYAKAQTKHLLNGSKSLELPLVQERLDVCATCEFRVGNRCTECGCPLDEAPDGSPGKAFYPTEQCPKGKWKSLSI